MMKVKMKLRIIPKKYAVDTVIQFRTKFILRFLITVQIGFSKNCNCGDYIVY